MPPIGLAPFLMPYLAEAAYLIPVPHNWPHYQATTIQIQNEAWDGWYRITDLKIEAGNSVDTFPVEHTFAPTGWKHVATFGTESVWQNPDSVKRA